MTQRTPLAVFVFLLSGLLFCACAPSVPPPATGVELTHTGDVRAVFQVQQDSWRDGVGRALFYVEKIERAYEARGVDRSALHFVVVFHGAAGYHLLNDAAFAAAPGERALRAERNPNAELVQRLSEHGIRIEMCSSTMQQHGWTEDQLLPEVIVVPNAYPRIIDLQMDGYSLIVF